MHGVFSFPRPINQLELVGLALHIARVTGAEFKYSLTTNALIQTGSNTIHQTQMCGPLRGTVTFTLVEKVDDSETRQIERIDVEGISSNDSEEYQICGLRSSYCAADAKGMRKSLSDSLAKLGDAIKTYFPK